MGKENEITLDNTFERIIVIPFLILLTIIFIPMYYLHLNISRIDTWIDSFMQAGSSVRSILLWYAGIIAVLVFEFFRIPYKIVLTENGITPYRIFVKPKIIKWEGISRFEIIQNKRERSKISLLIVSDQFSTERWFSARPKFIAPVLSGIRDKIRSLAERKMVREITDNSSIYPNEKSQFGEDVGS